MIIFDPKAPAASEIFAFDFTAKLGGDTISGTPGIAAVGVTAGAPVVDGALVKLRLSGGTPGTVATIACTIATANGDALDELGVLPIGGAAVDLATAKLAQKIEDDDDDVLLAAYLRAAIGAIERQTGKNLTAKVETQIVDGFPRDQRQHCHPIAAQGLLGVGGHAAIRLFKGPVSDILSIEYDDPDGAAQPLTSFRLVEGGTGQARLLPAYGASWPATAHGPGTVRINYVAGYDPAALPPELPQAAILLFGHYNANREAVMVDTRVAALELPLGVEWLLTGYGVPGIA